MKKAIKSILLLAVGLGMFTACSDDRDENPTLKPATEFRLNIPALANSQIDLNRPKKAFHQQTTKDV